MCGDVVGTFVGGSLSPLGSSLLCPLAALGGIAAATTRFQSPKPLVNSSNPGFGRTRLTNRSENKSDFFFRKVTLHPIGIFSLDLNLSTDSFARVIIGLWPDMVSIANSAGIICFLSTTALLPIPVFEMHLLVLGLCVTLV